MGALFAFGLLAVIGAALVGVLGLVWLVLKLVFLPIRLALGAVKLVAGLVVGLVGGIAMLVLAPIVAIGVGGVALLAIVVAAVTLFLPLLPFLLLGGLVWAITRRPAAAA